MCPLQPHSPKTVSAAYWIVVKSGEILFPFMTVGGGEGNGILNNSLASFAHARAAPSFLIAERRVSDSSRLFAAKVMTPVTAYNARNLGTSDDAEFERKDWCMTLWHSKWTIEAC